MVLNYIINFIYWLGGWLLEYFFIHHPPPIIISNIQDQAHLFELTTKNNDKISCAMITPLRPGFSLNPNTKYLIYSHGNSSTIESHIGHMVTLSNQLNVVVIEYDYIGYGNSSKKMPTQERCFESLECVVEYVVYNMNIDTKNIYLIGRSLGTGVVIDFISNHKWKTPVILFAPYKSIITTKYDKNFLRGFDKFVSIEKISDVHCPVKIFHGKLDKTVPFSHGVKIWQSLNNKSIGPTWLENAGHSDIFDYIIPDDYLEILNYCAK